MSQFTRTEARLRRHHRVRKQVSGTAERPRLNVFRSATHSYAQVIDDVAGHTLAAASDLDKGLAVSGKNKTERAKLVFIVVLAVVVAIAIKIVGALLTIAFLIMPAATARPLARTPEQMALIAGVVGMLAVAAGLALSVAWDTPAGPSIVLVLAALFAMSILPSVLRR